MTPTRARGFHAQAPPGYESFERQGDGIHTQGVAIVPAHLLRGALGYDRVLSDADVELLCCVSEVFGEVVEFRLVVVPAVG